MLLKLNVFLLTTQETGKKRAGGLIGKTFLLNGGALKT
jgi:hypothetical protein